MSDRSNYEIIRNNINLREWSDETGAPFDREPTGDEILRLLDALHHDIQGTESPEVGKILRDEWWNS